MATKFETKWAINRLCNYNRTAAHASKLRRKIMRYAFNGNAPNVVLDLSVFLTQLFVFLLHGFHSSNSLCNFSTEQLFGFVFELSAGDDESFLYAEQLRVAPLRVFLHLHEPVMLM